MLPGVCVQSTATRRGTQRVDGAAQHCTNAVATALGHAPGCMHVLPQRRRQTFGGTLRRKRFNQLCVSRRAQITQSAHRQKPPGAETSVTCVSETSSCSVRRRNIRCLSKYEVQEEKPLSAIVMVQLF